jgi:hypothetical protein
VLNAMQRLSSPFSPELLQYDAADPVGEGMLCANQTDWRACEIHELCAVLPRIPDDELADQE